MYMHIHIYIYIYIYICIPLLLLPFFLGLILGCAERLAESGWKPHRKVFGSKQLITGLNSLVYA